MKLFGYIFIFIVVSASFAGCQKVQIDYARTAEPADSPAYTVDAKIHPPVKK